MYNNKFGRGLDEGGPNARDSILKDIMIREDSLSSGSLHDYSEKDAKNPQKLKE